MSIQPVSTILAEKKDQLAQLENKFEVVKKGETRCLKNALIAAVAALAFVSLGVIAMVVTMGVYTAPLAAFIPALKGTLAQLTVTVATAGKAVFFGGAGLAGVGLLTSIGIGIALAVGLKPRESREIQKQISELKAEIAGTEKEESTREDVAEVLTQVKELKTEVNSLKIFLENTPKEDDTEASANENITHPGIMESVKSMIDSPEMMGQIMKFASGFSGNNPFAQNEAAS